MITTWNWQNSVVESSTTRWNYTRPVGRASYQAFLTHLLYTARNAQVATSLLTTWNRLVINKPISGCVRMACDSLFTTSLFQVVNRLDASCHQQTWCKLSSTDLMQVVTNRLDASCHQQTWCKLSRTDLMQVVTNRLDASCREQTWCKLPSEESALWSFVYALFWTKNGQTDCHISVVVFRKITRLLYTDQLAR